MPPQRRALRELPVTTVSEYSTVGAVKSALYELEQGIFTRSAQLVDAMGRDDRIGAVLRTRIQGLLGSELEFEPRGDGRRGRRAVKDVEGWFWKAYPEDQLSELLHWGLTLNAGIGELIWTRTERRWEQKLKVWHPQFLWWDWASRTYKLQTEGDLVEVTPGDGKWILFTPYGYERGWMRSLVRAVALPWLIRQWARRDWARWSEVHGLPIKKAKVPSKAPQAEKDAFWDELRDLSGEGLIQVPQNEQGYGYDLELLEAKADTWEGFQELLSECSTAISIAVLGQNLTTEVKGGSRAAASVHDEVRQDLKEYDAETLSTCLRDQGLVPWARWNLGDPELAPYPCWKTDPPRDQKAEGESLETLGKAVLALQNAGIPVDGVKLAEEWGIPLTSTRPTAPPTGGEPSPEDEGDDEDEPAEEDEDKEGEELSGRRVRLATGEEAPTGLAEGQAYADTVADLARDAAAGALAPDLKRVLDAIDNATTFEQLRAELPRLYAMMDPTALADLVEGSRLTAALAGRRSVRRDQ